MYIVRSESKKIDFCVVDNVLLYVYILFDGCMLVLVGIMGFSLFLKSRYELCGPLVTMAP